MLAMGDALAVALLERKGLTPDDFRVFHPGGKLGQRLVRVKELMHQGDELPLIDAGALMADALLVMTAKSFGCVGALDANGILLGVVTDGDLRRSMSSDLLQTPVANVMTTDPNTIRADALGAEAVYIMNNSKITSLFVVEEGVPIGILHIHDCLRAGLA